MLKHSRRTLLQNFALFFAIPLGRLSDKLHRLSRVTVQSERVWTDAELLEAEAKLLRGLIDGEEALVIENALYRHPKADCV